jgi:hypothetical protein
VEGAQVEGAALGLAPVAGKDLRREAAKAHPQCTPVLLRTPV